MKKNRKFADGWKKFTPNKNGFEGALDWVCTSSLHGPRDAKYGNPKSYQGCCANEACIAKMKVFVPTDEEAKDAEITSLKSRVTELEAMVKERDRSIERQTSARQELNRAYNNAQDAIRSLETRMRETDRKNLDLQIEKEKYRVLSIALAKFGGIAQ